MNHFLSIADLPPASLAKLVSRAAEFKTQRGLHSSILVGRSIGLIFEKPSTRTRVSFEVAVHELGAHPVVLQSSELQLGRGESIEDTSKVLSRYLHALVVRTFGQDRLERLAAAGSIPIINALSDSEHPCQALADLLTLQEHLGPLEKQILAYVGDGNNVAHSLLYAGALSGMQVRCITPKGYAPDPRVVVRAAELAAEHGAPAPVITEDLAGVEGATAVYTDVWASMGKEDESESRVAAFNGYTVDETLLKRAGDPIVLHCLPAHRGEEISAEAIDGPRSVVWNQAENRLHVQKAVLEALIQ